MTQKPPVLLLDLIDPSKNSWSRRGCAPFSAALNDGLFEKFGITPSGLHASFFHLAILVTLSKMTADTAVEMLLENPYMQYFCGFRSFQQEFGKEWKAFPRFFSELKKRTLWNRKHLATLLNLSVTEKSKRPAAQIPLRDTVSPNHALVLAKALLEEDLLKSLLPPSVLLSQVLLAVLEDTIDWTYDRKVFQACFKTNVYWQYFCGYEYFSDRLPGARPKNSKNSREIEILVSKAIRKGLALSKEEDPALSLLIERKLKPIIQSHSPGNATVEAVLPEIKGNKAWTLIAEHFKKHHWSTTFIGSDDVILAQKNLYGPLMRFVPASDKGQSEKNRMGEAEFADVVVEESTAAQPGKIILFSPGPDDPIERIEAAISPARSLDEFLARPEIQKRYFEALSLVYPGSRFPRRSYEAIIRQIQEILPEVPQLRERLWEPHSPISPSLMIRADSPVYGRAFIPDGFEKYLEFLLGPTADSSLDRASACQLIRKTVEETDERIRRFEAGEKSAKNSANRKKFYSDLRASAETQRALSLALRTCLKGSSATSTFLRKNSNEILNYFGQLKQNPATVLGDCGVVTFDASFWTTLLRNALPGLPELLRLEEIFPSRTRQTRRGRTIDQERYQTHRCEFTPVSRGLHRIWRGVVYNDCVGGNPDHLDQLMPERWACSLVKGAIFYDIVLSERILGYCQLVPFEYKGNLYASVDTQWSPFFNLSENGVLIFVRWLEKVRPFLPKEWKGLVVGGHPAGREPYETEILQTLPCYRKGKVLGLPGDVRFNDELAVRIVEASEKRGYGAKFRPNYGSRMLTDASLLGEQSPLKILNLES